MPIKYNWKEIQNDHNLGFSWRKLREKYGVQFASISKAIKRGDFVSRNKSQSLSASTKKRTHSTETKNKISIARKKFLLQNPDKVPYKLNHYSKGPSYPEKYFEKILLNNKICFEMEKQISIYTIDFLIGKIALEIDGEQHYLDERIVKSNFYRDEYLKSIEIETIRVRWANYQKLSYEEKQNYIKSLIDKLSQSKYNLTL